MKIKAGKKYVLNSGEVALAIHRKDDLEYQFYMVDSNDINYVYCDVNKYGINRYKNLPEYDVREEYNDTFMDTLIYKDSVSGNEFKTLEEYISFKENDRGQYYFYELISDDLALGGFSTNYFERLVKEHPNNEDILKYLSSLTKESNDVE